MKKIIKKIMELEIFNNKPPLLIDIGASGAICQKWQQIAEYSICIAFDADKRDFSATIVEDKGYRKLYKINRIVSADSEASRKFYLTNSPHCSSTLKPDLIHLNDWLFSPLFVVEQEEILNSIQLANALMSTGFDYIDWFKIDSQGTDLDIFLSLPTEIRNNILAADFEPGIIDAYLNEDKFHEVLKTVEDENMWVSSLEIKGTKRIHKEYETIAHTLRNSPCWGEITSLRLPFIQDLRSQLLLIVFSLIENQWGYALEIIDKSELKEEIILKEIRNNIIETASSNSWKLKLKNLFRR